ncbi:oxysterol-binding protein-related protein 9-like isoform X2 [Oppia nitens]|uniref:oxysterol-binding protein-related protein 9-like isoform X2 n=1 Tax=Oppia nitens TaxID=1686743 RepID=UPI0023DBBB75|nr:oxysterol-binding protein-related protein 9-like isoform X2 [Oppia nitens]
MAINTMEGPLCKWTNVMKGWQYRWFVLDDNAGLLSYYTSKEKMIKGDRRGCVRLKGAVIGIDDEDDSTFTITVDGKMFHFQAHDAEERSRWVTALEDTILRHTHRKRNKKSDLSQVPTLNDFERKLTETDSYLQLVINQCKQLDQKIDNTTNESEKEKLLVIKAKTLTLLDGIKHTIVLLQIAKNTTHPVNGLFTESSATTTTLDSSTNSSIAEELSTVVNNSNENQLNTSKSSNTDTVPEVSYSSSDDDDFYDAEEISPISVMTKPIVKNDSQVIDSLNNMSLQSINSKNDKNVVDFDSMYESEEEELGSIEGHGSVISHLISQVKIGMDLTKVVLPTFILERRSLLEMYADFFAHPDLFVSITDCVTPQDRMIQVLKWYLSAFHAGRKSSIAKKPYNPVLGEVFKCYWNVPEIEQTNRKVEDGPISWASTSNLTFIAEQVSHHPPISAFYAEHVDKRIMCSAHIYTKSKFLGLSIGVNNLGTGSIYLLDKGEEYVCTFPSAYGRSILTVPWVELGGPVTITCQQTGYSANIDFLTKPFYGGKKHRINAEVFSPPPTKKSIVNVSGEWNGLMTAKWTQSGKSEVFIDTKAIRIIKKQVNPIGDQESYESRNLWKEVTAALKQHDVIAATNAKFNVEQTQRQLVKERQEKSTKWENRVFHSLGDNWNYNNPLTARK